MPVGSMAASAPIPSIADLLGGCDGGGARPLGEHSQRRQPWPQQQQQQQQFYAYPSANQRYASSAEVPLRPVASQPLPAMPSMAWTPAARETWTTEVSQPYARAEPPPQHALHPRQFQCVQTQTLLPDAHSPIRYRYEPQQHRAPSSPNHFRYDPPPLPPPSSQRHAPRLHRDALALTPEERAAKIGRWRAKRARQRIVFRPATALLGATMKTTAITPAAPECRRVIARERPRIGGRFISRELEQRMRSNRYRYLTRAQAAERGIERRWTSSPAGEASAAPAVVAPDEHAEGWSASRGGGASAEAAAAAAAGADRERV